MKSQETQVRASAAGLPCRVRILTAKAHAFPTRLWDQRLEESLILHVSARNLGCFNFMDFINNLISQQIIRTSEFFLICDFITKLNLTTT